MNTAGQAANLRHLLLSDKNIGDIVGDLVETYKEIVNRDTRGTRIHDQATLHPLHDGQGESGKRPRSFRLSPSTYEQVLYSINSNSGTRGIRYTSRVSGGRDGEIFLSATATLCSRISIRGIRYQPRDKSAGNSNVLFYPPSSSSSSTGRLSTAGQIISIFSHTRPAAHGSTTSVQETFIVIRPFRHLTAADHIHDNFWRYGRVGGQLYYDAYLPDIVVRPEDIHCHFARTPVKMPRIEQNCIYVLSLDRVCLIEYSPYARSYRFWRVSIDTGPTQSRCAYTSERKHGRNHCRWRGRGR